MGKGQRTAVSVDSAAGSIPNSGVNITEFPSTHDISLHPVFKGALSHWVWRFCTHRMTRTGGRLFWGTVLLGLLGIVSLDLQVYVILLYAFTLWVVTFLIALCSAPRVRLQVRHAERVCAGETVPVEVTITQQGRLPGVDMQVFPAKLPLSIGVVPGEGTPVPTLRRGASARVQIHLYAGKRGVYTLKGYRMESDFPFGIMNAYRFYPVPRRLLVYPRFTPLAELHLPQGHRFSPGGVALKATLGDSFELLGNREYRQGDSMRDIDWRATARLNTPILREYTQEHLLRVGVVLDTQVAAKAKADELENFERAVSLCAAVGDFMARQEYLVDLFAAGPDLYHLTTGQNLAYLDEILDILACVETNPREPFATLEPEISQTLGKITLVICLFLDWDETRRRFVEQLAMHGVAVKAIVVREQACTLDPRAHAWGEDMPVVGKDAYEAGMEVL